MNVDTALSTSKASIDVIARNLMGSIIKAWTKQVPLLDPIVVKAMAIVWALELAFSQKFVKVIVESDGGCWKIRNFSVCSLDLISCFVSCNVQWVCKEVNQVPHALAKAVFSLAHPFYCSLDTFPPFVKKVWFRDLIIFAS